MSSRRKHAITVGTSLILMAVFAGVAFGYAHGELIQNDPTTTVSNLIQHSGLFHLEIGMWTLILILDLIVSWSLYQFFRSSNPRLSASMGGLRLIYSIILGAAISQLVLAAFTLESATTNEIFGLIQSFETWWTFGLIVFGAHLITLGWLAIKGSIGSKILAVLLFLGGVGYMLVSSAQSLSLPYETLENLFMLPMILGEMGYAFWLLIYGGRNSTN